MNPILRSAAWLAFFAGILASWVWLYLMATGMGLDLIGRPVTSMAQAMQRMDPRMDMYMPMAEFGPLFAMWAVMMAAMMLPTMVPTLRAYDDLIRSADGSRGGWVGLLVGYLGVWVAFAALIALVQLALLFGGIIDMLGIFTTTALQGGLLIAVGAFQFTRVKEVCHGACHAPMHYFLGHWRSGAAGGLRMGLALGAFCVGCCWGFMALGFVGGVMSLLWMGLATLLMVLEKLPEIGHRIIRPTGIALIIGGLAVLARPFLNGG